jgi:hypothetical protein
MVRLDTVEVIKLRTNGPDLQICRSGDPDLRISASCALPQLFLTTATKIFTRRRFSFTGPGLSSWTP